MKTPSYQNLKSREGGHSLCSFCQFWHSRRITPLWDTVLYQSPSFLVVPTLGSLLPGWVLIVPRVHVTSFSALPSSTLNEYRGVLGHVYAILASTIGEPTLFEHGARYEGSLTGCGVDHAHIHVASLPFSMTDAITKFSRDSFSWELLDSGGLATPSSNARYDYLWYQEPTGIAKIAYVKQPISQFFRRQVAASIGNPNSFDYKKFEFSENVSSTIRMFMSSQDKIDLIADHEMMFQTA